MSLRTIQLRLQLLQCFLQASKEYDAEWLGGGRKVYRDQGRFSKGVSVLTPQTTDPVNFDDILGKPDSRLNYASGIMKVFNPVVAQRYANAEVLSKELPNATTEEALAKRIAYMEQDELKDKDTKNPAAQIVQRDLDRRGLELQGVIDDPLTGFKALKVNSKKGDRPMLVAVGTETTGIEDIKEDLISEVGDDQYAIDSEKIEKYLQEQQDKGFKVEVSGHSLGGALSQMIVAHHPDKISKLTTFNGAGVPSSVEQIYEENVEKTGSRPRIEHHVSDGDFVSLAGDKFLNGAVYESGDYGNPIDAHLGTIGDRPELNIPIEQLNSPDYSAGFLNQKMTRQQQAVTRAEIQPVLSTIFGD